MITLIRYIEITLLTPFILVCITINTERISKLPHCLKHINTLTDVRGYANVNNKIPTLSEAVCDSVFEAVNVINILNPYVDQPILLCSKLKIDTVCNKHTFAIWISKEIGVGTNKH